MKKDNTWKIKMERIRRSKLWAGDMALVAVRVLEFLEENNKTQRWLADQLNVTPQQITKIVKGRQNLSWGKIKEIEAVLGIKLANIQKPECTIIDAIPVGIKVYQAKGFEASPYTTFGRKLLSEDSVDPCDHVTDDNEDHGTIELGQYVPDQSKRFAINS